MKSDLKEIIVAIPATWGTTIPPLQHSLYGEMVLENQFEALVRRGKNGLLEPLGARSWEISNDHTLLKFKIDTSKRFSDGSHLTAADFKRSWEDGLRMEVKSSNKPLLDALCDVKGFDLFQSRGEIEGIRVLGADTLAIQLIKPMRTTVEYLAGVRYAAYKFTDGRPIGTGPYTMLEKDRDMILHPNPFYAQSNNLFRSVIIRVTPSESIRNKFNDGAIDAALFARKSYLPDPSHEFSGTIRCAYGQEGGHVAFFLNGLPGRVFGDVRSRRALQAIVLSKFDQITREGDFRSAQFRPDPQSFLRFQPGRLPDEEALSIVQAGASDIPYLIETSKAHPIVVNAASDCNWLIAFLQSQGISISDKSGRVEMPRFLEMLYKKHDADIIFGTFSIYDVDPDGLYHILGTNGAIRSPMMNSPSIAGLLDEGRELMKHEDLANHYGKVARAIMREVPYIHLGYNAIGVAYNSARLKVSDEFANRNSYSVTIFQPR